MDDTFCRLRFSYFHSSLNGVRNGLERSNLLVPGLVPPILALHPLFLLFLLFPLFLVVWHSKFMHLFVAGSRARGELVDLLYCTRSYCNICVWELHSSSANSYGSQVATRVYVCNFYIICRRTSTAFSCSRRWVSFGFMAHLAPLMSTTIDHGTKGCVSNTAVSPCAKLVAGGTKPPGMAHKICKKGRLHLSHARQLGLETKNETGWAGAGLKRTDKVFSFKIVTNARQ